MNLKKITLAILGAAILAAPGLALASHPGAGSNGYHWPRTTQNHQIQVGIVSYTGAWGQGIGDQRWVDPNIGVHPLVRWNTYTPHIDYALASPQTCNYPAANVCIREINDANAACGTVSPFLGCAYSLWVTTDGQNHVFYRHVDLNLGVTSTLRQKDQAYVHELGHTQGLTHRAQGASVMEPAASGSFAWPDQHDVDQAWERHHYNTMDTYSFTVPTGKITASNHPGPKVEGTTWPKNNDAVKQVWSKVHPNGVIDMKMSNGETYRLNNKVLTKSMLDWYIKKGVLKVGEGTT